MDNRKSEILKAIGEILENKKFGTPGEYIFANGCLIKNPLIRSVFNTTDKEGILNKIIGNYFLAYGGHYGPKNPDMDKYCKSHNYDKYDYNSLLDKILGINTIKEESFFNY